jgi:hypothetical protein
MRRTEAEFCRDEAERLRKLATECTDLQVRQHLTEMAREWVQRAKAKATKTAAA